jgi:hypothetical protein
MTDINETKEILNDPELMKEIKQGLADIKAGRVQELRAMLSEEKNLNQHTKA